MRCRVDDHEIFKSRPYLMSFRRVILKRDTYEEDELSCSHQLLKSSHGPRIPGFGVTACDL